MSDRGMAGAVHAALSPRKPRHSTRSVSVGPRERTCSNAAVTKLVGSDPTFVDSVRASRRAARSERSLLASASACWGRMLSFRR